MPFPAREWLAVVADDLSGAAELAGAAWRFGLTAEVATTVPSDGTAEVTCIDTNTRPQSADQAAEWVAEVTRQLIRQQPTSLYKKTDSLLRGNVRAEIDAMLGVTGQRSCLLCPANPRRGRIIRDGCYWIHHVPLEQTIHAQDPTHPRRTRVVAQLLGAPSPAIRLPDVGSAEDLRKLANEIDSTVLPAGGVEFFEALLRLRGGTERVGNRSFMQKSRQLFVCGSPTAWSAGRAQQAVEHGLAVIRLGSRAVDEVCQRLDRDGRAMLAIDDRRGDPEQLSAELATAVANVAQRSPLDILLLEGGATALAVLWKLGWTRLRASAEIAAGTVLLEEVTGRQPRLVIKPGSYAWPDSVW